MTKSHFSKQNNSRSFVFFFAYFSVIIAALSLPSAVFSQTLSLTSNNTTYKVGDSFPVSLNLNTKGKSINTISGAVKIPPDKFSIIDVRYGNSIITLWVEQPKIDLSQGTISFTGGIPAGFNGSNGPILSFGVKAVKTGSAALSFEDIKILANDGEGTELKEVTLNPLSLTITSKPITPPPAKPPAEPKEEKQETYEPLADLTPPENFIPIISRNPSIGDNKYFVSFQAVDKDSGVAYYEISEKPTIISLFTDKFSAPQTKAESPYILKNQFWPTKIFITAYDQAGNYREANASKPMHPVLILIIAGVTGAVSAAAYYLLIKVKKSPPIKTKKGKMLK